MFSQERPPPCVLTLYAGNLPAPISSSCYIAMLCYLSCGHQQQFLPSWHSWSSLRYLSRPLSALHCERAMLCDTRPYICTNIYDTLYFFVAKKNIFSLCLRFSFLSETPKLFFFANFTKLYSMDGLQKNGPTFVIAQIYDSSSRRGKEVIFSQNQTNRLTF